MAEYIERDELLKFKADVYDEDGHVLYAVPTGYIVAMPSADVAPVVHGRWVFGKDLACCWGQIIKNKYHLYLPTHKPLAWHYFIMPINKILFCQRIK